MKDLLGVSPSKGNQGTTRGKENSDSFDVGGNRTHDLGIRSPVMTVILPTELRGRSNPEVAGSTPTEVKRIFFTSCGSLITFTTVNAQWVFHGLHIAL